MKEKTIVIPTLSPDDVLAEINEMEEEKDTEAMDVDIITETDKEEKSEKTSIYDLLEEEIMSSDISDADKAKKLSRLLRIRGKQVNIMLAGATGSGKSSTINALFNMEVAKIGVGVNRETDCLKSVRYSYEGYSLGC